MDLKILISIFAVVLSILGYIPYIYDILKKKTKPHSFTWFIWTLAGAIAYGIQVVGGAGVGSWSLLTASLLCGFVFLLSLHSGDKDIAPSDFIFLGLSLFSLFLWVVAKQPLWSVILITAVEIFGFIPTVRKSWNKPHSETIFTYALSVFRHALSILSLQNINPLTALYPAVWTVTNTLFTATLLLRRKK